MKRGLCYRKYAVDGFTKKELLEVLDEIPDDAELTTDVGYDESVIFEWFSEESDEELRSRLALNKKLKLDQLEEAKRTVKQLEKELGNPTTTV